MSSGASRVIVATDSEKIKSHIEIKCRLHFDIRRSPTGSDRICEALDKSRGSSNQVIVNLQGDEPLINPDTVKHLAILKTNASKT
ncbi:MAG: hypothetical protein CM15mP58_02870 [Burkholderiaceae bacterium]|nr:MAG: hypothetical protein CM15mP58_02870 [Burkholderiaceae bacterium]